MRNYNVISLLGSNGGVAKAVLSIINSSIGDKNDPIHAYMCNCKIHLIDKTKKNIEYFENIFPNLKNHIWFHKFDLRDNDKFKEHLKRTKTTLVIDVSWADGVEMLECCNELSIPYINSAFEIASVDEDESLEGFMLSERYRIFEENRNKFLNTTAVIASGMNPGVVQWMAIEMMKKVPSNSPKACYIVEHDDSFYEDKSLANQDTVYTTWSPECFLDEAILNYPMFVKQHIELVINKQVYEIEFKVTLGDKEFYGCLMPHEEVLTLGKLYDAEFGFIYRVNEHTIQLIRRNLDNTDSLWDNPMKVLDPSEAELEGQDLVGVLLVYNDKEYYMYNVLNNKDIFSQYKVNATYFQVACGIYGALSTVLLDDIPKGIYYVDELLLKTDSNYGKYLSYYMKDFIVGENLVSDGYLLDRIKNI